MAVFHDAQDPFAKQFSRTVTLYALRDVVVHAPFTRQELFQVLVRRIDAALLQDAAGLSIAMIADALPAAGDLSNRAGTAVRQGDDVAGVVGAVPHQRPHVWTEGDQ